MVQGSEGIEEVGEHGGVGVSMVSKVVRRWRGEHQEGEGIEWVRG